jgi:hypothetical protein
LDRGLESLGASGMTETGKYPELYALFPIGQLMELVYKFASLLDILEKKIVLFGMSIKGRIALGFVCYKRACRRLGQEHMACYFCHY